MLKIEELLLSMPHDLDLGSGHMTYHHASLIDLYPCTKCHSNRRNFLWTDIRSYIWTDIQTSRLALLGSEST